MTGHILCTVIAHVSRHVRAFLYTYVCTNILTHMCKYIHVCKVDLICSHGKSMEACLCLVFVNLPMNTHETAVHSSAQACSAMNLCCDPIDYGLHVFKLTLTSSLLHTKFTKKHSHRHSSAHKRKRPWQYGNTPILNRALHLPCYTDMLQW